MPYHIQMRRNVPDGIAPRDGEPVARQIGTTGEWEFVIGDGVTPVELLPVLAPQPGTPGPQGEQGPPGADSTVPGPPGADGVDGEDGTGLVAYPSMAALDAVTTAEVGYAPVGDYGVLFGLGSLAGITGQAIVETTTATTPTGLAQINQTASMLDPVEWVVVHYQRVKAQFAPGEWEPWSGWYGAEQQATEGYFGMVRLATSAEAQGMSAASEAVIQVKNLPQVAVAAATALRIIRRDASGRAQVATPSSANDIATKGYVDTGGWSTVPATPTSTGTVGAMARDASYLYVCTATNTWRRTALTTW